MGIINPRPAMRAREERSIREKLKKHALLTQVYIDSGYTPDKASKLALEQMRNEKGKVMTLCENCKIKLPTLATRLRKVNFKLHELGLTFHQTIPLAQVNEILESNGFDHASFSQVGDVHEEIGDGKWLSLSVYRMDSGRWEVTAYVN